MSAEYASFMDYLCHYQGRVVSWSQWQFLGATGSSTKCGKVTVPENLFLECRHALVFGARSLERRLRTPVPGTQVFQLVSWRALPFGVRGSSQRAVGL